MQLGEQIRSLRKKRRWSQTSLADLSGISRNQIANIEAGAETTIGTLQSIIRVLDCNAHLLGERIIVMNKTDLVAEPAQSTFTEREINEIKLCVMYAEEFSHGTDGHNRMRLIAKLAKLCTDEHVRLIAGDESILPAYQP